MDKNIKAISIFLIIVVSLKALLHVVYNDWIISIIVGLFITLLMLNTENYPNKRR